MSQNIGTLITAKIKANDTLDLIATFDANDGMGGLHSYATLAERDSIIQERRDWGMLCIVYNDSNPSNNKTYQLQYGYIDNVITNNLNWVEFSGGSGGGGSSEWAGSVFTKTNNPPISATGGDRYLIDTAPTGVWTSYTDTIAEYVYSILDWNYTYPTDGMSVRVDDEDYSIYRYQGVYPSGVWQKENLSQVRYGLATSISGVSYSTTLNPPIYAYSTDSIYVVSFSLANSGATASLSIDGLGHKTIKKQTSSGLDSLLPGDLVPNVNYFLTYDGTNFQTIVAGGTTMSGIVGTRKTVLPTDSITIPSNYQYFVYGDFEIQGTVAIYGELVIANGDLLLTGGGTYANYGTISFVTLQTGTDTSSLVDKQLNPATCSVNGDSTGLSITYTPSFDSFVQIYVNGQLQRLGGTVSGFDCYFSNDGGINARSLTDITSGDLLYWNALVAGFGLTPGDELDMLYNINI